MSDGKVHEICHDGRGLKEWQRIAVIVREEYNSSGSARAKRTNLRNKIAKEPHVHVAMHQKSNVHGPRLPVVAVH